MKRKMQPFYIINTLVMLSLCFITLYPIWFILINSFASIEDALKGTVNWLPRTISFASYQVVLQNKGILNAFFITVARTFLGTSLHVFFTAMVAYGMSKNELIGKKIYMKIGLITMLFSGGLIPSFILINKLNLYNSFWVFIFPSMFTFYDMVIFISFYKTIPKSIEESATVDGASDFKIFFRIIIPNSKAVLATIALFAGVYHWNDFYMGIIYIRDKNLLPIQTLLYKIIVENATSIMQQQAMGIFGAKLPADSIKFASMIIATFPILVLYPFLQKYLVKGVMVGALKG